MAVKLEKNAAGRMVPLEVNGREGVPFKGVGKHRPTGVKAAPRIASCVDFPADGDKRVGTLKEALQRVGLADGMVVSTHHHLRNGDAVGNLIFDAAADLGVKDLMWFPSASFPVHANQIAHLDAGVIHHIEGSMNGPLGAYCSAGKMRGLGVLRSHGGRWQAIQDGEVHIDVAVIAAPTADPFGNANGLHGPAACGLLGFALGLQNRLQVVQGLLARFAGWPQRADALGDGQSPLLQSVRQDRLDARLHHNQRRADEQNHE